MIGQPGAAFLAIACPTLAALGACAGPRTADIQSDDPNARILAIWSAADAKDTQAVPLIVDRLEDEDEAVRFYAILALDRITGERFGYDYAQPACRRAKSVEQWRAYVRRRGHAGSEDANHRWDHGAAAEAAAADSRELMP